MRPDELERQLRERLDALGPAPRAELLHVLMLPDFERAKVHAATSTGMGALASCAAVLPRIALLAPRPRRPTTRS